MSYIWIDFNFLYSALEYYRFDAIEILHYYYYYYYYYSEFPYNGRPVKSFQSFQGGGKYFITITEHFFLI